MRYDTPTCRAWLLNSEIFDRRTSYVANTNLGVSGAVYAALLLLSRRAVQSKSYGAMIGLRAYTTLKSVLAIQRCNAKLPRQTPPPMLESLA